MKQSEKLIGKTCTHPNLKLVTVDGVHENSRVLVDVTVIDRGKGYNDIKQRYTGIRISTGWYRGENRDFGNKDFVHHHSLKQVN